MGDLWRIIRLAVLAFVTTAALAGAPSHAPGQGPPATPPATAQPAAAPVLEAEERPTVREGPLMVVGLDDRVALRDEIEAMAYRSRARLRSQAGVDWPGTVLVVWVEDDRDYQRRTGFRAESTAAAASAARMTVWINASAWKRAAPESNQQTLTHELGHILVGSLTARRRLPLWAEEGLVMHLAGQGGMDQWSALAEAHVGGAVPSLASLEHEFPRDPARQRVAYATSWRAVGQVATTYGDDPGRVESLVRRLASPRVGPSIVERLWNPFDRDLFNQLMINSLGGYLGMLAFWLTTGSGIFILAAVLLVIGWFRVRARRHARDMAERDEEPWAASLTEADVQEIYGDREERFGPAQETPWERHLRERGDDDDHSGGCPACR